ncbi:MAG: DUF2029 domain-containing protein [Anaerolineae bacterium]|nr:DUF2029 domain-containing protein [Anaerolineae bacterium]
MRKEHELASAVLAGVLLGQIVFLLVQSPGEDFWQHYVAGRALLTGVSVNEALAPTFGRLGYPYPMFTVVLFLPLSLLPPQCAFTAWVGLLYSAVGASAYLFARRVIGLQPRAATTRTLLSLVWPVTFGTVFMGQISPLVLLFMLSAYLVGRRGKPYFAGALLCLALIKPHLVAPVAGGLLLRKRWRVLGSLALGALVLAAASLWLGQGTSFDAWKSYVLGWCLGGRSVMMPGALQRLSASWRLLIAACGYSGLSLWWFKKETVRLHDTALALLVGLLLSPYLPGYDLVLLVPVLVYLVGKGSALFWLGMGLSSVAPFLHGFEGLVALSMLCFVLDLLRLQRAEGRITSRLSASQESPIP